MLNQTQKTFIKLSLGLDIAPDDPSSAADLRQLWTRSKDSTDAGISALQSRLKGLGHPALDRIAEFGLNGITEGNQVAMMAALTDYTAATGDARRSAARTLDTQAATYQDFLATNAMVELIENNPFGITVDIRGPMGDALTRIRAAARAV